VIPALLSAVAGPFVGSLLAAAPLRPLDAHAILVLIFQLAVLVAVARILSEVARRLDQPAVIGELLAGILVGPSVLGALAPGAFAALFPPVEAQMHLLEAISWLGMILLLLLTGLETDVHAMREIGRPAILASVCGMVVPFAGGWALAAALPDSVLANPGQRGIFCAFIATTMTISAMPVIAKILLDLNLLKRNVGMVTLSAGIIDDTIGWIILSVIAGIATSGGFDPSRLALVLVQTGVFLVACRYVVFPVARVALKYVDDTKELGGTDMALIFVFTLVLAGATEAIGIHAVFGAFIAGVILRQAPRLRWRTVHKLESVVQSIFAPIFFAFVGVKVDLTQLGSASVIASVLVVAIVTKVVGCALGGLLGGLTFWESVSIGVGMSARGAMGLVVALVGLSLGILNAEMYSVIVLMAVATSLIAAPLLRFTVSKIRISEEERLRISDDIEHAHFRKERIKVIVPMSGGPNAPRALAIAAPLARRQGSTLTVLAVLTPEGTASAPLPSTLRERLFGGRKAPAARKEAVFAQAAPVAEEWKVTLDRRTAEAANPAEAIIKETGRGYDLLFLGASSEKHSLHQHLLEDIIRRSPCHVAIFKSRDTEPRRAYLNILVPSEGSYFANVAFELAAAYAEEVGARVTLFHVIESQSTKPSVEHEEGAPDRATTELLRATLRASIAPVLKRFKVDVEVRIAEGDFVNSAILREAAEGTYDLLVIGAENRALLEGLFLGHGTEYVVDEAPCSVLIVIPEGISGPGKHAKEG